MPEYLSPGVYIEEVNTGARPIEGVGTAMAAFVGFAPAGPANAPTLITNWGQYVETGGKSGEAVDDPAAHELTRLNDEWRLAADDAARTRVWKRILEIHAEQEFTIGLVANVRQPVVVSRRLKNVPEVGIYNWEPGSFFGIYRPDAFWFGDPRRSAAMQ